MYATDVYGTGGTQSPSYGIASPMQHAAPDDITSGWRGLMDPHNPLVFFGVILLVTVGLAGVAGSVRLGRARASASVDQG